MAKKNEFDVEEIQYLDKVVKSITESIEILSNQLAASEKELAEQKRYIWDNIYEMDMVEKASNVDIVVGQEGGIQNKIDEIRSLKKLVKSPYFGRIDFSYDDDTEEMAEKFYIGIRGFSSEDEYEQMVYDWRAPISSMFYDYEEGPASYKAPMGTFEGIIRKKRQYKIENGKLVFILNSSLKIDDEILQEALSHSTDNKMKNIVSTIQKEQNSIIRNDGANVLVVQGVAGSGKTSIALHRIAYILYTFKDKMNSSEMLVVSPNRIFSDYISNVLPELGETNIKEMSLEHLLSNELKGICSVEDRFDSLETIISAGNRETERNLCIEYKSSMDFYRDIQVFFDNFIERYVIFCDVKVGDATIQAATLKRMYTTGYISKLPYFSRFKEITDKLVEEMELGTGETLSAKKKNDILNEIMGKCLRKNSVYQIYKDFLNDLSRDKNLPLELIGKTEINYEDAFPLVFFKFKLIGYTAFHNIKHVVIDEMQDYNRIQFEILKAVFPCKMTILGDINQVLVPRKETVLDVLENVFDDAQIIKVNKTYRSTAEITNFASEIIGLKDVVVFDRHGMEPQVKSCVNNNGEIQSICEILQESLKDGFKNIAVICKDEKEAKDLYAMLINIDAPNISLCTKESVRFDGGIVILTTYLAKGLEFDVVIVPNVDDENYVSDIYRQLLYVSCTRALHKLYLLHTKNKTKFLNFI